MNRPRNLEEAIARWGTAQRPEILPEVVGYYEDRTHAKPSSVRVPFADGSTMIFDRREELPHPMIAESIRIIRKMRAAIDSQAGRARA